MFTTECYNDFTFDEIHNKVEGMTPLFSEGAAKEITNTVAYLASSETLLVYEPILISKTNLHFSI